MLFAAGSCPFLFGFTYPFFAAAPLNIAAAARHILRTSFAPPMHASRHKKHGSRRYAACLPPEIGGRLL